MRQPAISPGATAKGWRLLSVRAAAFLLVVLICGGGLSAYSVLTHEEIVDLLCSDEIRPLLLKRYPGLSEDQMKDDSTYARSLSDRPSVTSCAGTISSMIPR